MNTFAALNLVGNSTAFLQALKLIDKFSACDAAILITGETGTGKELAARAIHYHSSRRDGPFVPVNCCALPDQLVESEFFGHVKGAFTDARDSKPGLVTLAKGGSLFLDEIEAMSPRAQGVLLRFLQDNQYRPVGSTTIQNANVRIISASNAQLFDLVRQREFRSDLVFRLNALTLDLPPLRERAGDIMLLTQEFLARLNREAGYPYKALHPDCKNILEAHLWPGNIRELENLIRREFILEEGTVIRVCNPACDSCLFPTGMNANRQTNGQQTLGRNFAISECSDRRRQLDRRVAAAKYLADGDSANILFNTYSTSTDQLITYEDYKKSKEMLIAQLEKEHLTNLLTRTQGNLSLASRLSGRDRGDLSRLLKRHGIDRQHFLPDIAE